MPYLTFDLSPEKMEKIDARCELLGMTRREYADWMFTFGSWIMDKSEEGRVIAALDPETNDYKELQSPHLEKFREAFKVLKRHRKS
jgi:hypothetical protein